MPPSPVLVWMDSAAVPPSHVMAGPSSLWRLTERRSRKTGSGNIFSDVNLWQLQRLFRAAGDQDAEQRAQLVWGHGNEGELAQALISLRARSHRRGLRRGRDVLGTHWIRAFNHLRIGESSQNSSGKDPEDKTQDSDSGLHSTTEPQWDSLPTGSGDEAADRGGNGSSGVKRGGDSDPDRYLHRILH